jgi:hypothetical protein
VDLFLLFARREDSGGPDGLRAARASLVLQFLPAKSLSLSQSMQRASIESKIAAPGI